LTVFSGMGNVTRFSPFAQPLYRICDLMVISFRNFSELATVEVGVDSRLEQQSGVCATLHNTPVLDDKNLVCLEDGGEAMGDDHRGPAGKGRFERALDGGFGF